MKTANGQCLTLESREKNDVMKVAPMMSFQCSFLVIPVPRHWDPGNLTLNKWLHNKD
ncbi:MAG: WPE palindromic element domain-containing protein [Wolbachia sp.]